MSILDRLPRSLSIGGVACLCFWSVNLIAIAGQQPQKAVIEGTIRTTRTDVPVSGAEVIASSTIPEKTVRGVMLPTLKAVSPSTWIPVNTAYLPTNAALFQSPWRTRMSR